MFWRSWYGDGVRIPELYHHKDEIKTINNAFSAMKEFDADGLMNAIEQISNRLEDSICGFIEARQIDLLIVNNIWSVGLNLPAALAIERARKKFGLPAIGHHHDFTGNAVMDFRQPAHRLRNCSGIISLKRPINQTRGHQ